MNHKILNKLENMIHVSPQLLRNPKKMKQAIQGTFNVTIDDVEYENIGQLVDRIDDKVLAHYFAEVWHGEAGEITLTLTMTLTWHAPAEAWHGEAGGMQMRA